MLLNDCSAYHVGSRVVADTMRRMAEAHGIALATYFDPPEGVSLDEFDALIVNGEGTFHHNAPRSLRLHAFAERFGKPAYLFNTVAQQQSIDFAAYRRIVCRESLSARHVESRSPQARVQTIPDISFCQARPDMHGERRCILFIDSVSKAHSDSIERIAEQHGAKMLRLREWKRSASDLLAHIARHELVITGRFHGVVFAMLAGTPFFAFPSNTWKTRAMLEDFGRPELFCRDESALISALAGPRPTPVAFDHEAISAQWQQVFRDIASGPRTSRRTVLVGNGPSLMHAELGEQIDSFDEVVRFNAFRIAGFEKHTGTKTTLWSTFGQGCLPAEQRPDRAVFIHGLKGSPACPARVLYRITPDFYRRAQLLAQRHSTRSNRDTIRPSSGFLVTLWQLEVVGADHVHLAGFDHFAKKRDSRHHYYNPRAFGRPVEHDGDAEAAALRTDYAERITYL